MIANADTTVFDKYITFFDKFDISDELNTAGEQAIDDIKQRVDGGVASNGSTMDTLSTDSVGRYSKPHAKARTVAGLQTSVRDLNFTGEMIKDFVIIEKGVNRVVGGFDNALQADKAEYNEIYMGKQAFDLSDAEKEKATNYIKEKVSKQFASV